MVETVRIPQERVAVLIGAGGVDKRRIEKATATVLTVDEDGLVEICASESYAEFIAKDVVKAVGRGFAPHDALRLATGDYYLKIVDLKDILGSENSVERQKARIIGEEGKARRMIEECSGAKMVVYGGTVSLVGLVDEVELASAAITHLLDGKPHSFVYTFLEHGKKRMKEKRIAHMWEPASEKEAKK